MPSRRHAMVAHPRGAAGVSSSSSSDPFVDDFWSRYFRGSLIRLVRLCAAGLAACTLFYFLAPYSRLAETTTHFVTWYAAFGSVGIVLGLALRQWKSALLCVTFTLFYFVLIVPWFFPKPILPANNEPSLRIMTANLLSINGRMDLLPELVKETDPDILFVQELSPLWARSLDPLKKAYPYHVERTRSDHFGIGLYSTLPLSNVEVFNLADARYPAIRADIEFNGRLLSLLNMHTAPPLMSHMFTQRNYQLNAAATFAEGVDDLAIIAGDLNITMWSPYYRKLESESELRNVRRGVGILPTWPANMPFFQIALDHILVSPEILTVDVKRGPDIGSDHLPLVVDLFVPGPDTHGN